jgi:hypothetical protein
MAMYTPQQHAERRLARKGLRTNVETGEIEPIPQGEQTQEPAATEPQGEQTQEPAATETPAAGEDWQAKYEKLQSEFSAMHGRVAPMQRDTDTFRGLYETTSRELESTRQALSSELNSLKQQLAEANSAKERKSIEAEIQELLSEEDKALIDPSVLAVMTKIAGKFAAPAPKAVDHKALLAEALAEENKKAVDAHRARLMGDGNTEIGRIKELAGDAEFVAYCEEHPEVDMTLSHFLNAASTADIDRYAKAATRLISAYRTGKAPAATTRAPDPSGSSSASVLQKALARTAAVKMTEDEYRAKTNEFKKLIRFRDPASQEKAKKLKAELEAVN